MNKKRIAHLNSTACYLKKDNKVLMIKFSKKWGQVYAPPGGKFEAGESPLDCILREYYEETGLTLIEPKLQGISYWHDNAEGIIFIYTAEKYDGDLKGILSNIAFTVALFLDVNISDNFNLPFYVALTLIIPAVLIMTFERIKPSEIKNELVNGNKKAIFVTALSWGIMIVVQLRAYQLGNVTVIAPLCALTVMLNVIVGYLFLNERDNLLKKVISAILIIISIILIKL